MTPNELHLITGVDTKLIVKEVKAKYPDLKKFTVNSELPEGFELAVKEQAQEYAGLSGVSLPETTGDIVQTEEDAIVDPKVTEAFHYGILEAISHMRREDFALEGQVSAVEDIQIFRTQYNEVWSLYHQGEVTQQELRNQGLSNRLDAIAEQKQNEGKQLGKHSQVQACVTNTKQHLKERLHSLLG